MYGINRKYAGMFILGASVFLTACGGQAAGTDSAQTAEVQAENPGWLDNFYNGSYEYVDSTINAETGEADVVVSGKRISSPYSEYVKIVEPDESLWSEAYYYGDGEEIEALIHMESGYVTQQTKRGYPYGYGEELVFSDPVKETVDGIEYDVYETGYTVDLAEQMNEKSGEEVISEPLQAVVSQKYYVDPEKNELTRIVTDLTDQTAKTEASSLMMSRGISAEEALAETSGDQIHDVLEITAYDKDMTIEIPDHNGL